MKKNTWFWDCLWLTLFLCLLFGMMLGCRALSVPDEGRYSEIPREMLWFHDFITPHLDGIKYFEKPPLLYWMQAAVMSWFGMNEWALRAPTAIMASLGCLSVYATGRFLFDRCVGILAALILGTSPLYFAMAHSITLDMTVSVWMTVTLLSFIVATNCAKHSAAQRNLYWLMFASAACAVLTKGLIGIVLPGMVVVTWLIIFNRFRDLKWIPWFSGFAIFFCISLPWHILVQIKNPEFFHFYFIDQHILRYLTNEMNRYQPSWWFIPVLLLGLFPWVIFLCQAMQHALPSSWRDRAAAKNQGFLLIGVVEIFLFFSFSHSKLIPYIVPVLPLLALLIAHYLVQKQQKLAFSLLGIGLLVLSLALVSTKWWPLSLSILQHNALLIFALPFAFMGIGVLIFNTQQTKLKWIVLMQVIFLWCLVAMVPNFDLRPIKPLAVLVKQLAKPGDVIVNYGEYHQDLPAYSGHFVLIVNWINELAFGAAHQPSAKNILLSPEQFWLLWQKPVRVIAVMGDDDYQREKKQHVIYLLARSHNNLLVSNQL